jgi:Predicted dehydrogenases and related proteins
MNIGILGTGFGSYHAAIYKKMSNVDSLTIFGRNEEKLRKIEKDLQLSITNNIEDIITNKNIDLIDVCLPISMHREYAIEAMKNGKDVFCETPVALSLEDAMAIKQAADEYGKKAFVNMFIRFEQPYEYIYTTIKENSLGKLKALHIRRKTPHLWGDLGLSKITTNLMIHELDFVTWLLGIPKNIKALGVESKAGESHISSLLNFNDTVVEIQASSMLPASYPFSVSYEAIFEDGTIEYMEDGFKDREEKSLKLFTNHDEKSIEIENRNCYEESIKHVIECCEKNIPTRLNIDDAISSLKIALEIKDIVLNH